MYLKDQVQESVLEETWTICINIKIVSYHSLCALCTLFELVYQKSRLIPDIRISLFSYSSYLWPKNYVPRRDILRIVSENMG